MYTVKLVRAPDCAGVYRAELLAYHGITNFFVLVGTNKVIAIRNIHGYPVNLNLIHNVKILQRARITPYTRKFCDKTGRSLPKDRMIDYRVRQFYPRGHEELQVYDLVG